MCLLVTVALTSEHPIHYITVYFMLNNNVKLMTSQKWDGHMYWEPKKYNAVAIVTTWRPSKWTWQLTMGPRSNMSLD